MPLLQVIEDRPGFVKATLQGPQGSGKSRTAVELATKTHELFHSKKPIAFFDTESGSDYLVDLITQRTGLKPLRVKTRAFSDLLGVVKECQDGASDVLIVDSVSHCWRELQDGYMRKINEGRRFPKNRMDIGDIMGVKKLWEPWPDIFLNSAIHIVCCGREGNEWGHEENEETGKRELVTVGKKLKCEGEFGYEASLMVAMSIEQIAAGVVKKKGGERERRNRQLVNVATIIKDRFDVMNGQAFEFPTGDTFMPFLSKLNPPAHAPVDVSTKTHSTMPEMTEDGHLRIKRERTIALEEIVGELTRVWPGQSAKDKACKAAATERAFDTRSWTRVEGLSLERLRAGLAKVREIVADPAAFEESLAAAAQA